jgi:hypothetical protein
MNITLSKIERYRWKPSKCGNFIVMSNHWPVLKKFYDRKFTIVNYASVWSVIIIVIYDHGEG